MTKRWLLALPLLCLLAWPAWGETIHLSDGEVIRGRIIRTDDATISVESDKGFGVIQVNKSDITLIEYENKQRDPSHLIGLGYLHRSAPTGSNSAINDYGLDALSLKYWLSSTDSIDTLLGYFNSSQSSTTELQVLSLDLRYATVFQRKANLDLYFGGSAGFLSVIDKTNGNNINDTGTRVGVFLGIEAFFVTLPNLGISGEVGFSQQTVGKSSITDLSTTTFPTFSIHYYF